MLKSFVALLGQLRCSVCSRLTDQFAHWHSFEVWVQAMGCASAALWLASRAAAQACMEFLQSLG